MLRSWRKLVALFTAAAIALPGCSWPRQNFTTVEEHDDASPYDLTGLQLEQPCLEEEQDNFSYAGNRSPVTIADEEPVEYWDLKLEEAVQLALSNTKVMRDLGGLLLRSPATARSIYDPAITETDPRFGVEAALSQFDANFATSGYFEKNDRALNNVFFGGGTRLLQQDGYVFQSQITKRAVVGSEFTIRNNTDYDSNNAPGNRFFSSWNTNIEALVRQPILQGAGLDYNRIYGPNGIPGLPSGVLLGRVNTDQSLADFEMGVRNYLSDIENAYWDLYFSYRDLETKIAARDAALDTWRRVNALNQAGRRGGEAQQEAQAREQYYRFQEDVQNSLTGRLLEPTHVNNGSQGGTFRGNPGVHVAERRMRRLIGAPINDGRLIRPADEPQTAKSVFDWDVVLAESLTRRPELRRTKWQIKRRELELLGSKNLLLPRFDAIGRYRWRGFGKDLFDTGFYDNLGEFSSAWNNLAQGNFQEWQLGFEFSMPLGFRKAHVTVRNAELQLARERALLVEQERDVISDLSNTVAEVNRAYAVMQTSYNRRVASKQQLDAIRAIDDPTPQTLYLELDAQRRLAEAQNEYYRTQVEYGIAVKNVHFDKGSLLDYNGVFLSELAWPTKAYEDAYEKVKLRTKPSRFAETMVEDPLILSSGLAPQNVAPSAPEGGLQWGTNVPSPGPAADEREMNVDEAPPVPQASRAKVKRIADVADDEREMPVRPTSRKTIQEDEGSSIEEMEPAEETSDEPTVDEIPSLEGEEPVGEMLEPSEDDGMTDGEMPAEAMELPVGEDAMPQEDENFDLGDPDTEMPAEEELAPEDAE